MFFIQNGVLYLVKGGKGVSVCSPCFRFLFFLQSFQCFQWLQWVNGAIRVAQPDGDLQFVALAVE